LSKAIFATRFLLRDLNAAAAAVKIEGDRLPKGALDMTGVEAPPKK